MTCSQNHSSGCLHRVGQAEPEVPGGCWGWPAWGCVGTALPGQPLPVPAPRSAHATHTERFTGVRLTWRAALSRNRASGCAPCQRGCTRGEMQGMVPNLSILLPPTDQGVATSYSGSQGGVWAWSQYDSGKGRRPKPDWGTFLAVSSDCRNILLQCVRIKASLARPCENAGSQFCKHLRANLSSSPTEVPGTAHSYKHMHKYLQD